VASDTGPARVQTTEWMAQAMSHSFLSHFAELLCLRTCWESDSACLRD
jgi:hypothetical protein